MAATSLPINVPKFMVNNGSVPSDVNPRIPVNTHKKIIRKLY